MPTSRPSAWSGPPTLTVLRKGGKTVTVPLAPRTARAVDLAIGERLAGPIFLGAHGDGSTAMGRAHRAPCCPPSRHRQAHSPHTLRHAFITAALDVGVPLRDVQEAASHADPRTTAPRLGAGAAVSLDRHATYIVATYIAGASR